ncbi:MULTISPECIES: aldo/keto reductase [unclassified Caballeronia]|uniref:aldo/keto reductase n=1 Tax=unclassified Caballeronia TaxID=2646786 RepID=UPI00285AF651|nr:MULTISPECIES: aldo/keto reductase [unclassified Caballeronia]MDR5738294.1 aldo/keto reductase [Caballeronia sp. LZ016]MDR5811850.1 aldo/keto reductase [Caballeronia sp. LZ019]
MVETIPSFGLGTFRVDAAKTVNAVRSALQIGYRHIDTAQFYKNEAAVGQGVRDSGIPREDVWVTTKVWWERLARDKLIASLQDSHAQLDIGTIDLALVHWPSPDSAVPIAETLAAMQEAQQLGLIRHYGVSNFTAPLLEEALNAPGGSAIVTNQIEVSPFLANRALVEATQRLGVKVTAYMPLGEGRAHDDPTIRAIAAKHGATPAQVTFAWLLSRDIVVLSASTNAEHQQINWDAQKLELDADDIAKIDALDEGKRNANPSFAPKW